MNIDPTPLLPKDSVFKTMTVVNALGEKVGDIITDPIYGLVLRGENDTGTPQPVTFVGSSTILGGDQIGMKFNTSNKGDFPVLGTQYTTATGQLVYAINTTPLDVVAYSETGERTTNINLTTTFQKIVLKVLVNEYDDLSSRTEYLYKVLNNTNQDRVLEMYLTKDAVAPLPEEIRSITLGKGSEPVVIEGADSTSSGDLLVGEEVQLWARCTTGTVDLTVVATVEDPASITIEQNASQNNPIQKEINLNSNTTLVLRSWNRLTGGDTYSLPAIVDYNVKKPRQLLIKNETDYSIVINGQIESTNGSVSSLIIDGGESYILAESSLSTYSVIGSDLRKLDKQVKVKTSSDFGVIDSTKVYFLDGIINMTGVELEVPEDGMYLTGHNFDLSGLICDDDNYTLFNSPVGGSGNILYDNIHIDISGTNSQVYDIKSKTGFEAIEIDKVNFNNCTSLGIIDNYRQGLETGTGRFGGTPELTLKGTWIGGYFIDTSIVRLLADGAYTLYKAGVGFIMGSRFRSNQNIDLPANASFLDFSESNFINPSTLQLDGCIMTRNGVFDAEDTNYTPNISASSLVSAWNNNNGLENTFVGGVQTVTTESTTTISDSDTFYDVAGTFTPSELEHFDSPANGQLRHLGINPREYRIYFDAIMDGNPNRVITLRATKWDDSASVFVTVGEQIRQINSLVGGRDVAFMTYSTAIVLDQNDYIKLQVANNTDTSNITMEEDSSYRIEQR
jgi:hypothetical protein